jgi:hypothetical protein
MKFLIEPGQVFVFKFVKKVGIGSIEEFELLILELLPSEGFFAHFDLIGLNQRKWASKSQWNPIHVVDSSSWAGNSQRNTHSSDGFLVYNLVIPGGITFPPMYSLSSWGGNSRQNHHLSCVGQLDHHVPKVLRMVAMPGFLTLKDLYCRSIFFKRFIHENVIKK